MPVLIQCFNAALLRDSLPDFNCMDRYLFFYIVNFKLPPHYYATTSQNDNNNNNYLFQQISVLIQHYNAIY